MPEMLQVRTSYPPLGFQDKNKQPRPSQIASCKYTSQAFFLHNRDDRKDGLIGFVGGVFFKAMLYAPSNESRDTSDTSRRALIPLLRQLKRSFDSRGRARVKIRRRKKVVLSTFVRSFTTELTFYSTK